MSDQKKASSKESRKCFLVGPIGEDGSENRIHADWVAHIVERALDSHQIEIIRADRIPSPGQITAQIIDHVMNAELVVADLTFLNANAFYELGIRHAVQKPTIHVFRNDQSIPFDVADSRAIPISYSHPSDVGKAVRAIKSAADNVFSADHKVWSPVTGAIAFGSLSHSDEDKDRLLAQLVDRVDRIEHRDMERISSEQKVKALADLGREVSNLYRGAETLDWKESDRNSYISSVWNHHVLRKSGRSNATDSSEDDGGEQ